MIDNSDQSGTVENDRGDVDGVTQSFDHVIEQCFLAIEQGDHDIQELISRYPQWEPQIIEFFENWGIMQRATSALVSPKGSERNSIIEFPSGRFGDYELLEKIGIGGMGVIYKARQISLDRIVALKMIHSQRRDGNRFKLEAEAAAALSHPNVVSIFEIGEHQGRLFFSMELIEGSNLRDYLKRGPVDVKEAARIAKTIAEAVHYAHQHGILHRDLKPANILVDIEVQPHVTDFGLAKQLDRDTEITKSGTIMGTPGYMSPEQATGKTSHLTIATDVYGIGAILYALLTGEAPFKGESSLEALRRVIDEAPVPPRTLRPEIERDIDTICLKCLEKSPQARYSTALLLADDLSRFLLGQPVQARPIPATERFWRWCVRNPAYTLLSVAVGILLLATTIFSILLAMSEHKARVIAQEKAQNESRFKYEIEEALAEKQLFSVQERKRLAETCLDNAFAEAACNNTCDALLWFSQAAHLTTDDQLAFRSNYLRTQSWLAQQTIPIAAWRLDANSTSHRHPENLAFRRGSDQLLLIREDQFLLLDSQSNQLWALQDSFPEISCAVWCNAGQSLAIGQKTGGVLILDPESREIVQRIEVGGLVDRLESSTERALLAISSNDSAIDKTEIRFWDFDQDRFLGEPISLSKPVGQLSLNRAGSQLVVTDQDSVCTVYTRLQGQWETAFEVQVCLERLQQDFWPTLIADESVLMCLTDANTIFFHDLETGSIKGKHELDSTAKSIIVDSDNRRVLVFNDLHVDVLKINEDALKSDEIQFDVPKVLQFVDRLEHEREVVTADIGPDSVVATAGQGSTVFVWRIDPSTNSRFDVPYRRELLTSLPHQTALIHTQFSCDGSQLVTIDDGGLLRIWQIPKPDQTCYRVPVPRSGSQAKLIGRNRWLATGHSRFSRPGHSGSVENATIHDIDDGQIRGSTSAEIGTDGTILDAACSPDHRQLATVHAHPNRSKETIRFEDGNAGSLRFWNLPDYNQFGKAIALPSEPRSIEYRPDGQQLAICTMNMEIVLVDANTLALQDFLIPKDESGNEVEQKLSRPVYYDNGKLKYSPDGSTIVAWGSKRGVWVWDVESRSLRFPVIDNRGKFSTRVEFSPDGTRIAIAGGRSSVVQVFDLRRGAVVGQEIFRTSVVNSARFSPDGDLVIAGIRNGRAEIYDWRNGDQRASLTVPGVDIVDACYTPDSKYVLTLGLDHRLRVWCSRDFRMVMAPIRIPPWSRQIHVSRNSRHVVVASGRHEIACVDLNAARENSSLDLYRIRLMCELLAGKTVRDITTKKLSTSEWVAKWDEYRHFREISSSKTR